MELFYKNSYYNKISWKFFVFVFFITILGSVQGIFYIFPGIINNFIVFGAIFYLYIFNPTLFFFSNNNVFLGVFLLFSLAVSYFIDSSLWGWINFVFFGLILFYLFNFRTEIKIKLLETCTKWLAIFLLISLGGWLLWKLGVPFYWKRYIPNPDMNNSDTMYVFKQYFLFLTFDYEYFDVSIPARFQAFFIEPGYLGTICLLFMAANDFNFKNRYVLILFLMMSISLSLASYIIFYFVYFIHLILKRKIKIALFILGLFILLGMAFLYFLPEDNIMYVYIFNRIFNEDGLIYNRSTLEFDSYFWNYFCHSPELFWGSSYGLKLARITQTVDFKFFLVHYGLISLIIFVLFYFCCFLLKMNRKTLCLSLVMGLILFQSSWLACYLLYISIYILGLTPTYERLKNFRVTPIKSVSS